MHISDWLPTLYAAAGGNTLDLDPKLDGINMWKSLLDDLPSERKEVLHNIDDIYGIASLRVQDWKIVKGSTYNGEWDGWYGPSGHEEGQRYDVGQILGSKANKAISTVMTTVTPEMLRKIRHAAIIRCGERLSAEARFSNCKPLKAPCLFNIANDPCERDNLADRLVSAFQTVIRLYDQHS